MCMITPGSAAQELRLVISVVIMHMPSQAKELHDHAALAWALRFGRDHPRCWRGHLVFGGGALFWRDYAVG